MKHNKLINWYNNTNINNDVNNNLWVALYFLYIIIKKIGVSVCDIKIIKKVQ